MSRFGESRRRACHLLHGCMGSVGSALRHYREGVYIIIIVVVVVLVGRWALVRRDERMRRR